MGEDNTNNDGESLSARRNYQWQGGALNNNGEQLPVGETGEDKPSPMRRDHY